MLAALLSKIQRERGYLPPDVLESVARGAGLPLAQVQEFASFFPSYRLQPPKPLDVTVKVCRSMVCHLRGSEAILESIKSLAKDDASARITCEGVSCVGRCDRAPVACVSRIGTEKLPAVHDTYYSNLPVPENSTNVLSTIVQSYIDQVRPEAPQVAAPVSTNEKPWRIDVYAESSPPAPKRYAALRKVLGGLSAADVIKKLKDAGLVGMGGALARTAKKWAKVLDKREGGRPKDKESPSKAAVEADPTVYVVCNGDESEPGTFKDRELLLRTPHLIVEGILIAALVLKATRAYIYIRHEYHEQIEAVRNEIKNSKRVIDEVRAQITAALPKRHWDNHDEFKLEVVESPGLYICGEESALLEVLEGRRAQPRNAPPEIADEGLFSKPTVVNNVETFAWVPGIVWKDGWYQGERFFSISGDVQRPGVYEVPGNITLGDLIDGYAGGLSDGHELKAVATSGPSAGFMPATIDARELRDAIAKAIRKVDENSRGLEQLEKQRELDRLTDFQTRVSPEQSTFDLRELPLDGLLLKNIGLMLGAGIVVYGRHPASPISMLSHARNCLEFFEQESCGKCVPCRLGCQELVHYADRLKGGPETLAHVRTDLHNLTETMRTSAICGLGRGAMTPLLTIIEDFPDDLVVTQSR